jgi:hypothetical protein
VQKYNVDRIPLYISCPKNDLQIFKNSLPKEVNVICDEDIIRTNFSESWKSQQIVKSNFWKYIDTKNYLCIDSDSYFIRPFTEGDFIAKDDIPLSCMSKRISFNGQ